MPDLSSAQSVLASTIFLYPSREAAEAGEQFGGSGVLIGKPLTHRRDLMIAYAVTNWHVACSGGNSIIKYTDFQGRTQILETDPSEWEFIPGGPDIAACIFGPERNKTAKMVPDYIFASDAPGDIFIGEDVFMAGRFVDYDGKDTNRPALRFGAVSMLDAPIKQPTGSMSPSHIVDMHSRTGFSGSPVYAYRPRGRISANGNSVSGVRIAPGAPPLSRRTWGDGTQMEMKLLGLQWGQFPEMWEVVGSPDRAKAEASLVTDGQYVTGFSGMSCVIPAHQIQKLLDRPALKAPRDMPL